MADTRFKEYRKDGWPLCPACEEDELYSHIALGATETASLEEALKGDFSCYRCNWDSRDAKKAA